MCYNKIGDESKFQKLLTYNVVFIDTLKLILLYDSKAKSEMNWNNFRDVIKANIRALNLS